MAKNAVAKQDTKSTAVAEFEDEFAQDAADHKEAMDRKDMSIPFLQILQSLSPQCTRGEAEYIKGAEPSMLFDTVTKKTYPTRDDDDNAVPAPVRILPVFYKTSFIEWVPRSKGGGYVDEYDYAVGSTAKTAKNDSGQDIIQNGSPVGTPGNQLVETHTHFVFVIQPDGSYEPAVMSMSSTAMKASRDLNTMVSKHRTANGQPAARFFGIYSITTQFKSNEKGSWYIPVFEKVSDVQAEGLMDMYRAAREFNEGIKAGEHKADHAKHGDDNGAAANPNVNDDADDEIPL